MAIVYEPTEEMKAALNSGTDPYHLRVMYDGPGTGWGTFDPEWVISVKLITERTGLFGTVRRIELVLDNTGGRLDYPYVDDGEIVNNADMGMWSSSYRMAFVSVFDQIADDLCWFIGPVANCGVRRELCLNGERLLHVTVWDWATYLQHKAVLSSGRVKIVTEKPALTNTGSMLEELQGQGISKPLDCVSPVTHPVGPVVLRRNRSVWEEMNSLADSYWAGLYYGADEYLKVVNSPYDGNRGDPEYSSGWVDHPVDAIDASLVMSDSSVITTTANMEWMFRTYIGVDWQRYSVDTSTRELWRLSENYSFFFNAPQAWIPWYGGGRSKLADDEYWHMCIFRPWDERPIVGAVEVDDSATIHASIELDPPGVAASVESGGELSGEESDDWLQLRVVGTHDFDEVTLTDLTIRGKPVYDEGITPLATASVDDEELGITQRFHSQYLSSYPVYSDSDITVTHAGNFAYRFRLMKESESEPILLELKGKPVHWNCSERVELADHGACLPERIVVCFGRGETWTTVEARHYDYGARIGYREKELYLAEQGAPGLPRRTMVKSNDGAVYTYNPVYGNWSAM